MMEDIETQQKAPILALDKGYIKLIKNSKSYGWEIKGMEDLDEVKMVELVKKMEKINNEMLMHFGGVD